MLGGLGFGVECLGARVEGQGDLVSRLLLRTLLGPFPSRIPLYSNYRYLKGYP